MCDNINNISTNTGMGSPAKDDGITTPQNSKTTSKGDEENLGGGLFDGSPEAREHTRSKMAILFVLGFFSILFICVAYAGLIGANLTELKDVLVAIIGSLSGTLGFIVGYYYKSQEKK